MPRAGFSPVANCVWYHSGSAVSLLKTVGREGERVSEKILLVDDDPNVLAGYRRQLRKSIEFEVAEGGAQGLEILARLIHPEIQWDD